MVLPLRIADLNPRVSSRFCVPATTALFGKSFSENVLYHYYKFLKNCKCTALRLSGSQYTFRDTNRACPCVKGSALGPLLDPLLLTHEPLGGHKVAPLYVL